MSNTHFPDILGATAHIKLHLADLNTIVGLIIDNNYVLKLEILGNSIKASTISKCIIYDGLI